VLEKALIRAVSGRPLEPTSIIPLQYVFLEQTPLPLARDVLCKLNRFGATYGIGHVSESFIIFDTLGDHSERG